MDESLDLSGIEESVHVGHSCSCGYYSRDKSNYNKHVKRCKWALEKCTAGPSPSTSTPAKKTATDKTQPERQQYICVACGKTYLSKYGLNLHVKSKHENKFKHKCTMCDKQFNQTIQYRYHCSKHLNVSMDKCPHCPTIFTSHGSLKRHLKTCSMGSGTAEQYKCDLCHASFPHKYRLVYHQRGKHQPHRYRCQGCNKTFAWRSSLKVHTQCCKSQMEDD